MTHATVIQVCILAVVITNTTDVIVDHPTIVHVAAICGEENVIYFKSHE